jgi:hypothetical protein
VSLKPTPIEPIQEQTARITRAAFFNNNSYRTLHDERKRSANYVLLFVS